MTEDEAKTKWCPFTRVGGMPASAAAGISWNRWPGEDVDTDGPANCIGSACMAWRTAKEYADVPVGMLPLGDGWKEHGPARGAGGAVTHRQQWEREAGFCGLAGRPS